MVHRRVVDDEILVFGNQGALWGNAMTWWDHSTGSVWSQPLGAAIAGPRKGQTLDLLTSEFTSWQAWRDTHPSSLALDAPGRRSGFDLSDFLLVVDFSDQTRAYPVPDVRNVGVVNDVVAGVEIAVVSDPTEPDRWAIFSRQLADTIIELEVDGVLFRDTVTGTTFDARGFALEGELEGEILDRLPAVTAFHGDYDTFWPDGTLWRP